MDAAIGQRLFHPLIDQPFMGGVLVDNNDAVFGLGHDIGFVQLGAGDAELVMFARRFGGRNRRLFHPHRAGRFEHGGGFGEAPKAIGRLIPGRWIGRRLSLEGGQCG